MTTSALNNFYTKVQVEENVYHNSLNQIIKIFFDNPAIDWVLDTI